jgi:hypothetical protein
MKPFPLRRSLAFMLTVGLLGAVAEIPALAGASALFQGRVLDLNGITPRGGARVNLVDSATGSVFTSTPTDDRGRFSIASAPAGRYSVVVETTEGAFLASSSIDLRAGRNPAASLALQKGIPAAAQQETPTEPPKEQPKAEPEPPKPSTPGAPQTPTAAAAKKGIPLWAKWVIVGGVAVIAAIAVNEVTKSEEPSSPF